MSLLMKMVNKKTILQNDVVIKEIITNPNKILQVRL